MSLRMLYSDDIKIQESWLVREDTWNQPVMIVVLCIHGSYGHFMFYH